MTDTVPRRTTSPAARKAGFAIAIAVNAVILYLVNAWPGWQSVPFLTPETSQVLGIFNLSLIVGIIVNAVYLVLDLPPIRALGDLITLGIGLAVLVGLWEVFPFDFQDYSFDWTVLIRAVLIAAMVGTGIGLIVQLVLLIRSIFTPGFAP
ncbi:MULTISPECIES: hypothetical protein [unclassified Cryobacterium]|uniref:hypothetical protein n=1 Tax=unclassified Cryobacterium TaxID=2649013 RepID=UPI00106B69B9|nr:MULTISPECIES: hypothetical protein [unclassified Cryobacterium]TFD13629.1 hypothetical protein E3T42_13210 [Cryobacterium sp. TMT4-10]TFD27098.1 hypothetical protein E3T32_02260 [Cryobacterium sp. TMT2-23]